MKDFLTRLKEGPILCDGAMGTLLDLYEYPDLPHEIQNIRNPEIVQRIHEEYIDAGAEIIQTNTFSGNRLRLAQFHFEDQVREINRAGVEIARRAAGTRAYVAGSVGPTGKLLEPLGKLRIADAREVFREQIAILLEAGVDLLMLETFVSLSELDAAIDAAKDLKVSVPIVAQKAFPEDGAILSGTFPVEVVEHLISKGVDVVGANCTVGPQRMFSIIRSMYKDGVIMSAQPAAGIPTLLDGRSIYHTTPEYLAQYARELLQAGVTIIGACCGSTPAHIRAMKSVMDGLGDAQPVVKQKGRRKPEPKPEQSRAAAAESGETRSRFARNMGKKFLTTVELDIPRGLDMSSVIEGARYLRGYDIDAINITDGARARLRLSPIAISHQVQTRAGIEAITHLATRDRNMISLQSELMSAHSFGLHNILAITGDPTNIGDYPQATSVFDIDSSGLIRAAKAMNEGRDLMGNAIDARTSFLVACAANPMADNMDREIAKMEKKVAAGVDIVFTQPIYELRTLEQFLKRIERWNVPVMVGVLPLRSYKHAEFLHNEIPGMVIPDPIRERLRHADDRAADIGIEQAIGFLSEAKSMVAGAYLMPPFKKYDIVPRILDAIR